MQLVTGLVAQRAHAFHAAIELAGGELAQGVDAALLVQPHLGRVQQLAGLGVQLQRLAHVKAVAGKNPVKVGQGPRQGADAGVVGGLLGKTINKALEMLHQPLLLLVERLQGLARNRRPVEQQLGDQPIAFGRQAEQRATRISWIGARIDEAALLQTPHHALHRRFVHADKTAQQILRQFLVLVELHHARVLRRCDVWIADTDLKDGTCALMCASQEVANLFFDTNIMVLILIDGIIGFLFMRAAQYN